MKGQDDFGCHSLLEHGPCVGKWIDFIKEIPLLLRKTRRGNSGSSCCGKYHKNNILHMTIAPARIQKTIKEAVELAVKLGPCNWLERWLLKFLNNEWKNICKWWHQDHITRSFFHRSLRNLPI